MKRETSMIGLLEGVATGTGMQSAVLVITSIFVEPNFSLSTTSVLGWNGKSTVRRKEGPWIQFLALRASVDTPRVPDFSSCDAMPLIDSCAIGDLGDSVCNKYGLLFYRMEPLEDNSAVRPDKSSNYTNVKGFSDLRSKTRSQKCRL